MLWIILLSWMLVKSISARADYALYLYYEGDSRDGSTRTQSREDNVSFVPMEKQYYYDYVRPNSNYQRSTQYKPVVTSQQTANLYPYLNNVLGKSCTTEWGWEGRCVIYYQCDDYKRMITDGRAILDKRNSRYTRYRSPHFDNGGCPGEWDICCSVFNVSERIDELTKNNEEQCGWSTRANQFEQEYAMKNEFPWMVSLNLYTKTLPPSYTGGGSLIHRRVVLTAAHVVSGAKINTAAHKLVASGGMTDLYGRGQVRSLVKSIKVFMQFNEENLHNDIALLFLETPLPLRPVCLPSGFTPSSSCLATGWGNDKHAKDAVLQTQLKKIKMETMEQGVCQRNLRRRTRLGLFFSLHRSFLCAGGGGRDVCARYSGSPLVCLVEKNRYVQTGIVSWGVGCGMLGVPGVYTNVAKFKKWIDRTVEMKGFSIKYYSIY